MGTQLKDRLKWHLLGCHLRQDELGGGVGWLHCRTVAPVEVFLSLHKVEDGRPRDLWTVFDVSVATAGIVRHLKAMARSLTCSSGAGNVSSHLGMGLRGEKIDA